MNDNTPQPEQNSVEVHGELHTASCASTWSFNGCTCDPLPLTPQPLDLDAMVDAVDQAQHEAMWCDCGNRERGDIEAHLAPFAEAVEVLRTERDRLAAVIEQVREHVSTMAESDDYPLEAMWRSEIMRRLSAAPSDALAEVKRDAAADALEQAAAALLVADWTAEYPVEVWLGGRAAATRAGRS